MKIPIFDLDGSLLDSAPDIGNALNEIRREFDLEPLTIDFIRTKIGGGLGSLLRDTKSVPDASQVPRARDIFMAHYGRNLLSHSAPFDGVETLLSECSIRGLVTNKPRRFGKEIIEQLGWTFTVSVYGDDGYGQKPEPGPIARAIDLIGYNASDIVYFGDSDADVLAAQACGVAVWLFPWSCAEGFDSYKVAHLDVIRGIIHG
ncbi:MAG: HAD-IA family hydrolase [Myxococcota bacterium]|nr:HAD-IA family hydrolase [Myxococcota bacterium]